MFKMSRLRAFVQKRGKTVINVGNGNTDKEISIEEYSSYKNTNTYLLHGAESFLRS